MIDRQGAPVGSPGCFGRALSYRAGTPECATCPFSVGCRPLSEARTRAVRARMGVVDKAPRANAVPAKPVPAIPQAAMGLSLPVKVVELLGRLERAGTRVTESLARRENPFKSTPAFMRVICHVILKKPEGVSRAYLAAALKHQFGWADTTAVPHVTQAVQALEALGAIRVTDGVVVLTV